MEKNNKAPVVIVFAVLSLLIIASIIGLIVLRKNADSEKDIQQPERKEAVIDFELSQLAEKAKQLVNKDLAEPLRQGDVPFNFISDLRADLQKADKELSSGNLEEARNHYDEIVSVAEAKLDELKFAESARKLKDSTYIELSEGEYLKDAFANTYNEAVETYNQGLQNLEYGEFEKSIGFFETTSKILEELAEQSAQQLQAQLESAEIALSQFDTATARASYERALEIDASNAVAKKGLLEVEALEAIIAELDSLKALQESGDSEEALAGINELIEKNPGNAFLLNERKEIETTLLEDKRIKMIEQADAAEADGELAEAISALEAANKIRLEKETAERLIQLKEKEKKERLEVLLETGYDALKAGNYDAAKTAYDEALAIDPKSEEARSGIEKTSSMYLASIRYNKSIESAAKYLDEGRIPLATKFYNEALAKRPSVLSFKQKDEEVRIRKALAMHKEQVNVIITSDNKTYVSLIGVFAPERFKKKEIMLYPDVYTFKGTRGNYSTVESKVKVSKPMAPGGVRIVCTDRL